MAERKGSTVNWALFAVLVQVSGYKAHKCPHSDFVTITSLSTSTVKTNIKGKGKSPITSPKFPTCDRVSDVHIAGQKRVSDAPMKSPNPSFVNEGHVCNMKK